MKKFLKFISHLLLSALIISPVHGIQSTTRSSSAPLSATAITDIVSDNPSCLTIAYIPEPGPRYIPGPLLVVGIDKSQFDTLSKDNYYRYAGETWDKTMLKLKKTSDSSTCFSENLTRLPRVIVSDPKLDAFMQSKLPESEWSKSSWTTCCGEMAGKTYTIWCHPGCVKIHFDNIFNNIIELARYYDLNTKIALQSELLSSINSREVRGALSVLNLVIASTKNYGDCELVPAQSETTLIGAAEYLHGKLEQCYTEKNTYIAIGLWLLGNAAQPYTRLAQPLLPKQDIDKLCIHIHYNTFLRLRRSQLESTPTVNVLIALNYFGLIQAIQLLLSVEN